MLRISIDTSSLDALLRRQNINYRRIGQQMDLVGGYIANTWEAAAYGMMLPGMTRPVNWPAYAETIEHHQRGELEVVVYADAAMTEAATRARPAWDMKPGLLSGPKARTSKSGHRFNVIPLRHKFENLSTPAIMALVNNVRNYASELGRRSKILPTGSMVRTNPSGQYNKTGPLTIPVSHYTWKTGHESGIRLTMNGPVTFRTVSDRSDPASWWYPAKPENPIIEAVWNQVRDEIEEWIFTAWMEAINNAFNAGTNRNS